MKRLTPSTIIIAAILAVLAFYLLNRTAAYVTTEISAGVPPQDLISGYTGSFAASPFAISFAPTDVLIGLSGVVVVLLGILYRAASTASTRPGEEHGSAAWGGPADAKPFQNRKQPQRQLLLTQTESLSTEVFTTRRNCNVLVTGASGAGKTRGYIIPNLRNLDASTATTDPKGEIIQVMRPVLEERGIGVRTLNLIDLKSSGHFNPMRYFNPAEPETGIAQLVWCIVGNTSGGDSKGDDFWERAERALLTALVAYVWATTPETATVEPNLPAVLELQKGMQGSEENKDARESETDLRFAAAREIVEEWKRDPKPEQDATAMQVLDFACRQYRVYEQGPAETRMSIVISLGVRLAPLDMHDVREILKTDDLAIDRLGYEPTALFLQIPDTHTTFRFIAAMFWQTLYGTSIYLADHEENNRLPRMVHTFLDEFPNIGTIPGFERLIATIRSRGISASLVFQSYAQGKDLFNDAWEVIVDNCDTKLFLGGDGETTTKWVSGMLGDETITVTDTSESRGASGSWSQSTRSMQRALMTPDEVGRLSNELAIVKIRGVKPFKSKKLAA